MDQHFSPVCNQSGWRQLLWHQNPTELVRTDLQDSRADTIRTSILVLVQSIKLPLHFAAIKQKEKGGG